MATGATPKIRLSPSERVHMLIAFAALAWPMLVALLGNAPWRMFGSTEAKRAYWRNVALVMIRTGGHWFSIRHLQFLMPNDRNTCRLWGWLHSTSVTTEEVSLLDNNRGRTTGGVVDRNPSIHWIGPMPSRAAAPNANNQTRGEKPKVVLYIHGGGFVLPLSNASITMMTTLLREANDPSYGAPVYLALAEYTISPYAVYPTQIRQCLAIVNFLSAEYGIDSSNLVLAGDSCGGSICLSILSQLLHPSPNLPVLPYVKGVSKPLAGVLLISPWTSLTTTAPSYAANADRDTLPPNVIRRFRDTYLPQSDELHPASPATPVRRRIAPIDVASVTGPYYEATPDPHIKGLERGAGTTRPLDSFRDDDDDEEWWWSEMGDATQKVMITTGEEECFRDDILDFAKRLQNAVEKQRHAGKGPPAVVGDGGAAVEIEVVRDNSFHAVLVSDFAFGAPPGALAATLSGWLVQALRD